MVRGFFLVQVAQTKASYCTYDESNSNAVVVRQGWASPQSTVGSGEAAFPCQVTNSGAEPVLRYGINQTSFYHAAASMRFAFTSLLSVFTAGNKRSNRSEGCSCPFLGQTRCSPSAVRVEPQQCGGAAGLRHAPPRKGSAGGGAAACGVMVCSSYNCGEADCLARAEPPLPR